MLFPQGMRRKIQAVLVLVALLAPSLAALCQWQCHFMPSSEAAARYGLTAPPTHRMECCAVQETALRTPAAAPRSSSGAPAPLVLPPAAFPRPVLEQPVLCESPPGTALLAIPPIQRSVLRI